MKKLMIAAAIVCVAALSQAAAFTWSSEDAYMPFTLANIKEGTYSAASSGSTKTMAKWGESMTFFYTMTIDGEVSSGEVMFDNKAIAVNADNAGFVLPTTGSKTMEYDIVITASYNDGTKDWAIASDHITGTQDYTAGMSLATLETAAPTEWTFTAAPEPTSGLLLLLGMGALALRRRRA